MKRKDSILANFYYQSLPKAKEGGNYFQKYKTPQNNTPTYKTDPKLKFFENGGQDNPSNGLLPEVIVYSKQKKKLEAVPSTTSKQQPEKQRNSIQVSLPKAFKPPVGADYFKQKITPKQTGYDRMTAGVEGMPTFDVTPPESRTTIPAPYYQNIDTPFINTGKRVNPNNMASALSALMARQSMMNDEAMDQQDLYMSMLEQTDPERAYLIRMMNSNPFKEKFFNGGFLMPAQEGGNINFPSEMGYRPQRMANGGDISIADLRRYPGGGLTGDPNKPYSKSNPDGYFSMKNNQDWFDNHAIWTNTGDTKFKGQDWDDYVRQKVMTGKFGLDPRTGALVTLDKNEWSNLSDEYKEQASAEWGKKSIQERFSSKTPAGKAFRKKVVAESMKEAYRNPIMYAPAAIAAAPFVAGAAATVAPAVTSALSAPLTIGSTTIPYITGNTMLGLYGGYEGSKQLSNPNSVTRQSIRTAYNNPTFGNIMDATGNTLMSTAGVLGSPGMGNFLRSTGSTLASTPSYLRSGYSALANADYNAIKNTVGNTIRNIPNEIDYFINKPKDIYGIKNPFFLKKEMGAPLGDNTGSFNFGVYRLKRFPELVKFENPMDVTAVSGQRNYGDFDFVNAMKDIQSPNIAKVLQQQNVPANQIQRYFPHLQSKIDDALVQGYTPLGLPFKQPDKLRALFMPHLPGTSVSKLSPSDIRKIPSESFAKMFDDIKELRSHNLGFDFVGDNFMYDKGTKTFKLFDINPVDATQTQHWREGVLGGGDLLNIDKTVASQFVPALRQSGENIKGALGSKLYRSMSPNFNQLMYDFFNGNIKTGLSNQTMTDYNNKNLELLRQKLDQGIFQRSPFKYGGQSWINKYPGGGPTCGVGEVNINGKCVKINSDEYREAYNKGIGSWQTFDKTKNKWVQGDAKDPNAQWVGSVETLPTVTVKSKANPYTTKGRKQAIEQVGSFEDFRKQKNAAYPSWYRNSSMYNADKDYADQQAEYNRLLNTRQYQNVLDAIPQNKGEDRLAYMNRLNSLAGKNFVNNAKQYGLTEPFDPSNLDLMSQWAKKTALHTTAGVGSIIAPFAAPTLINKAQQWGNQPVSGLTADEAKEVGVFQPFETSDNLVYNYGFKPLLQAGDNLVDPGGKKQRAVAQRYAGPSETDKVFTSIMNPLNYIGPGELFSGAKNLIGGTRGLRAAPSYIGTQLRNSLSFAKPEIDAIDYMKSWYAHPEMEGRYNMFVDNAPLKNSEGDFVNWANNYSQRHKLGNARLSMEEYVPKTYRDLWKDKSLKDALELHLTSAGVSYGVPEQIYTRKGLLGRLGLGSIGRESTTGHELGHLANYNGSLFNNVERNTLLSPFNMDYGTWLSKHGNKKGFINSLFPGKGYYLDPTEIYSRMMQGRYELGLSPDDIFTMDHFNKIKKNNGWFGMGSYIKDPERMINVMNNFYEDGGESWLGKYPTGGPITTSSAAPMPAPMPQTGSPNQQGPTFSNQTGYTPPEKGRDKFRDFALNALGVGVFVAAALDGKGCPVDKMWDPELKKCVPKTSANKKPNEIDIPGVDGNGKPVTPEQKQVQQGIAWNYNPNIENQKIKDPTAAPSYGPDGGVSANNAGYGMAKYGGWLNKYYNGGGFATTETTTVAPFQLTPMHRKGWEAYRDYLDKQGLYGDERLNHAFGKTTFNKWVAKNPQYGLNWDVLPYIGADIQRQKQQLLNAEKRGTAKYFEDGKQLPASQSNPTIETNLKSKNTWWPGTEFTSQGYSDFEEVLLDDKGNTIESVKHGMVTPDTQLQVNPKNFKTLNQKRKGGDVSIYGRRNYKSDTPGFFFKGGSTGSWLKKYNVGGEDGPGDGTLLKDKKVGEIVQPIKNLNLRPTFPNGYYNDIQVKDPNCTDPDGLGCSYQATREAQKITGLPFESYAPANAGYRDAVAQRTGLQNIFDQEGEQKTNANSRSKGWKYPTFDDFKKWKAGDIVTLDAGTDSYFEYDAPPGFSSKDNTSLTHNGVIVGFTPEGRPVIRHGYATGQKGHGQQLTEVLGDDNRVTALGHGRYAVKSVWRPKEVTEEGSITSIKPVVDKAEDQAARKESTTYPVTWGLKTTNEEKLQNQYPVAAAFSGADNRLATKNNLVSLFNDNRLDKELQYQLGINAETLQNLKPVLYGIAGQETNFDDVDNPLAAMKDVPGNLTNTGNSKGLFQIKYDSLTEDERNLLDIKSPNDLLDNRKAYKAAMLMMYHAKNRMDSEVEEGTHPGLKKADPFFRAAYYYNQPARAISTAKQWAQGSNPVVPYDPTSWLNPLVTRERPHMFGDINPNYVQQVELRMDKGSYPYKLMEKANDLLMDNTASQTPEGAITSEPIVVYSAPKGKKLKMYNK